MSGRRFGSAVFILVVLFTLSGSSSSQTTQEVSGKSENVRAYRIKWRPTREVVEVLVPIFPDFRFRHDPNSGSLIVEGNPDRLKPIEQVIASVDVPRPEVNMTVHLLWGRKSNLKVPIPKEVAKAEPELRKRFKFNKYELANSIYLPALESSEVKAQILPGFLLECAVDRVEPTTGTLDVRIRVSRSGLGDPRLRTVVETGVRVSRGEPALLGGIPLDLDSGNGQVDLGRMQPDRYLVLVLDADIPQPKVSPSVKERDDDHIERTSQE